MASSAEVLQMEASKVSHRIAFSKGNGCYVTRKSGLMLGLFFVGSVVITAAAAAALVLHFGYCSAKDEANPADSDAVRRVSDVLDSSNVFAPESRREIGNGKRPMKVRLTRLIVPDSYEIKLIPFLTNENFTFLGEVKITVNVTDGDADRITLHVKEIEIEEESVVVVARRSGGETVKIDGFSNDTEQQVFVIRVRGGLLRGEQYQIGMKYRGILNDKLQGFYRSSYTVGNATR